MKINHMIRYDNSIENVLAASPEKGNRITQVLLRSNNIEL